MDFHLKQWRDHPSHSTPSPKLPSAALPLFDSEPNSNLSAFPSDHSTRIPRMGSYFSSSQWQELELQALIFRHMIAGADVPTELLHLVKKSLITSPFYLSHSHSHTHNYYPQFHQSLLQSGYWGRAAMDPEPGRCRRTDGKKWRCSRDVVAGQKYCERHMHRGKNRSRKHVETPTSAAAAPYGGADATYSRSPHFTLSVPSQSIDLLHLHQRPLNDGKTLQHLFNDWPKPVDNENETDISLSISMPSSDFSLKLGTGTGDGELSWGMTWEATTNQAVAPMGGGGPLAEVLRSSISNSSSPTSVLHRLARPLP